MSTTAPLGILPLGRSTIFWNTHGCDELRSILRRTLGSGGAGKVVIASGVMPRLYWQGRVAGGSIVPHRFRFRLHLAAIAVVSLLLGASLYAHAHAGDYKTFGQIRRALAVTSACTVTTAAGARVALGPDELAAILAAIPEDTPVRPTRSNIWISRGDQIGQLFVSIQRASYYNLNLATGGGEGGAIGGDSYGIDYGPETADSLRAAFERATGPKTGNP